MEVAGSVFAGMSVASMLVTSGITINLTENAGDLFQSGAISTSDDSTRLHGGYADSVLGMSAATIGLSSVYLGFFGYGIHKHRRETHAAVQIVYLAILVLAMLLAIISSALNIDLVTGYTGYLDNGQLDTDPSITIPGENYRLRGSLGTGVLGMAITTTVVGSLVLLEMLTAWGVADRVSKPPVVVEPPTPASVADVELSGPFSTTFQYEAL